MLQLIQHQSTGELLVADLPAPQCPEGCILVSVANSLISAGTERTSVSKAQSSLLQRAMKQPQEVKKVFESVRKDGLMATVQKVQNALDSYKPLGYSASGTVIESRAEGFLVGDRVACAGNNYAFHAEIIAVPKNLVVKIPDEVSFVDAAYTTLGAIAMQGVRQAAVELGMSVAVIGLGLLGQITVQLLKSAGCRVVGLDVNEGLFAAAAKFGADATLPSNRDAVRSIEAFSRGLGVDAVIITAATDSNAPVELAMEIVRKRGTVVVVGAVGMNLPRSPFYEKEVEFRISCSYGPGRYDPSYEEYGNDYPAGYVRWTENRNMQSFLDLVAQGKINVDAMTTHRFPLDRAAEAYSLITGKTPNADGKPYSGIVLDYPRSTSARLQRSVQNSTAKPANTVVVGFIGAGAFAQTNLLPHLKASNDVNLRVIATPTPVKAKSVQERFGFERCETSAEGVFGDVAVNLVICASRHDSHGGYVAESLRSGKNIFMEKPLCVSLAELAVIDAAQQNSTAQVMVGFNRRFSPPFSAMQKFFAHRQDPMSMLYRVNAGTIPPESWIQGPAQGGRIIGEVCHFIDCMVFLSGSLPVRVFAEGISTSNTKAQRHDTVNISLKFADGSIGTVQYLANGDSAVPKEYYEVFADGKTAQMHNFEALDLAQGRKISRSKFDGTKGHKQEMSTLIQAVKSGRTFPIGYEVLRAVTLATFAAEESLQSGLPVNLSTYFSA